MSNPLYRPCFLEVSLQKIEKNLLALQNHLHKQGELMLVIKANGYGLGAVAIAKKATTLGLNWFGVSLLEEAINLRQQNIEGTISMLGGWQEKDISSIIKNKVIPFIYSQETAHWLQNFAKKTNQKITCHLKIDTGMSRLGFSKTELQTWLANKENYSFLEINGIASHFARADKKNSSFTIKQQKLYQECCLLAKDKFTLTYTHIENSAAFLSKNLQIGNVFRIGLGLYGYSPFENNTDNLVLLEPSTSWYSSVVQIHTIQKGDSVGYGNSYTATKTMHIGTIAVGYADGFSRTISPDAFVLIRGQKAPLVGKVCMDMLMVDITNLNCIQLNDKVTLLGKDQQEEITATMLANWQNMIVYELFCRISSRVPRVYLP